MVARLNYQRLEDRKEKGWTSLALGLGEALNDFDPLEWYDWMDAEADFQEVVEKVVVGRKRHYKPPTVKAITSLLQVRGRKLHLITLAALLERRQVLAPPSVLFRILESNLAPRGPFKRYKDYRYGMVKGRGDVIPRTDSRP